MGPRAVAGLVAAVLLTLVGAVLSTPPRTAAAEAVPPNIWLITTDDQAVRAMDFMPFTRAFFARHGATFAHAVAPYPLCCPARATLLTGQLSHNHRVLTNSGPYGGFQAFEASGQQDSTLPTWLQSAGYRTMFVGKYLNGYRLGTYPDGVPPGWDEWNATVGAGIYDYDDFTLNRSGTLVDYRDTYQTDVLGQIGREFIDATATRPAPFFIWESHLAPHGACELTGSGCVWKSPPPAEQDANAFPNLGLEHQADPSFNERVIGDKPAHIRRLPRWDATTVRRRTHDYRQRARSLLAVDRSIENTVTRLQQLGRLDNTLIIFTSDNGHLMGQHRAKGKTLPYQASLRVPLLMAGPGIPAGVRVTDTVALVDIAPTIAAAAQATPTLLTDGQPLQPVAQGSDQGYGVLSIEAGPQTAEDWPRWFYRGVRTRRYTYVVYPGTGERELYDRTRDPYELTNRAYRPAYHDTLASLAGKLDQLARCRGAACHQVSAADIPEPEPEPHLASGVTVHPDDLASIGRARQVVTVTAADWSTPRGRLTTWTRYGRTWTIRRGPLAVRLGANGLIPERRHRRGDGQTPAGTFRPDSAFGLRPEPETALRYRRVRPPHYWVFDARDPSTYNTHQRTRPDEADWRTTHSLRWRHHTAQFPRALLMRYNLPRPGSTVDVRRGSLIAHVGDRLGRHGWLSMPRRNLTWLLSWMRPHSMDTRFVIGTPGYLRSRL